LRVSDFAIGPIWAAAALTMRAIYSSCALPVAVLSASRFPHDPLDLKGVAEQPLVVA
jgi:hypothetical protein